MRESAVLCDLTSKKKKNQSLREIPRQDSTLKMAYTYNPKVWQAAAGGSESKAGTRQKVLI
jgi:hypothetical protein